MADIQQQIRAARAEGYSDDEIAKHLSQSSEYGAKMKMALDEGYKPSEILDHLAPIAAPAPVSEIPAQRKSAEWGDLVGNILPSAGNVLKGIGNIVVHPLDTVQAMSGLAYERGGGAQARAATEELLGTAKKPPVPGTKWGDFEIREAARIAQAKQQSGQLDEHFARYASPEGIKQALITDPAGTAMDLSMLLNATAGVTRASGRVAGLTGRGAEIFEKGAQLYETGARYTNPLTPMVAAVSPVTRRIGEFAGPIAAKVDTALQGKLAESTAAKIAQEAAGGDINAIRAAQAAAEPGITAAQATAGIPRSQYQALGELARSKDTQNYYRKLDELQAQAIEGKLSNVAGGATQTEILNNLRKSEQSLNALTTPMREAELAKVNVNKTLNTDNLVKNIEAKLANPKIGVSKDNRTVLNALNAEIQDWTARNGGIIDADALYEIRKNTVNEAIGKLTAGQNPSVQAKRAAQLLNETKPLIDDAIETAGGKGWKAYLDTFSKGKDVIAQREFAGIAKEMYEKNPKEFVRLVRGDNTNLVQDVFGKGRTDIRVEMGDKFKVLDEAAQHLERAEQMKMGAALGEENLRDIVKKAVPTLRLPYLGLSASTGNLVLKELSGKLNTKTMKILEEGFKTGADANELLNKVPFGERSRVYDALLKVNRTGLGAASTFSNALAPENRNNLRAP